jgi:hypothetical protein
MIQKVIAYILQKTIIALLGLIFKIILKAWKTAKYCKRKKEINEIENELKGDLDARLEANRRLNDMWGDI